MKSGSSCELYCPENTPHRKLNNLNRLKLSTASICNITAYYSISFFMAMFAFQVLIEILLLLLSSISYTSYNLVLKMLIYVTEKINHIVP